MIPAVKWKLNILSAWRRASRNSSIGVWTATATLLQNAFIHALVPKLDQHVTVERVEKTEDKK